MSEIWLFAHRTWTLFQSSVLNVCQLASNFRRFSSGRFTSDHWFCTASVSIFQCYACSFLTISFSSVQLWTLFRIYFMLELIVLDTNCLIKALLPTFCFFSWYCLYFAFNSCPTTVWKTCTNCCPYLPSPLICFLKGIQSKFFPDFVENCHSCSSGHIVLSGTTAFFVLWTLFLIFLSL